jgi:hypothetical protein
MRVTESKWWECIWCDRRFSTTAEADAHDCWRRRVFEPAEALEWYLRNRCPRVLRAFGLAVRILVILASLRTVYAALAGPPHWTHRLALACLGVAALTWAIRRRRVSE